MYLYSCCCRCDRIVIYPRYICTSVSVWAVPLAYAASEPAVCGAMAMSGV